MNSPSLTNEQVVLVALWQLRGDQELVDVEDVAMSADGLAPGRFRWRKYTDQVNIQYVGKALRDAKQRGLVVGTSARGWMLTDNGVSQARELSASAPDVQHRRVLTPQQRAWTQRERVRLLAETAYKKIQLDQLDEVTERELLKFFRLDEYVVGELRRERVARITHSFADDPELGPAIKSLAQRVPQ